MPEDLPIRSALADVTNHADKIPVPSISTSDRNVTNHVEKRAFPSISTSDRNVTNHVEKRAFSVISTSDGDDSDSFQLAKKECLTVPSSTKASGDEFIESQESRCGLEFDGKSTDLMKTCSCSCSICIKAGYLLSDLHYQDIKGRIAVINKSQKEAGVLIHRNTRDNAVARSAQLSKLDSDLTGRWNSLFLHMEDVFLREAAQLEISLSALKEVRDSYNTRSNKN